MNAEASEGGGVGDEDAVATEIVAVVADVGVGVARVADATRTFGSP